MADLVSKSSTFMEVFTSRQPMYCIEKQTIKKYKEPFLMWLDSVNTHWLGRRLAYPDCIVDAFLGEEVIRVQPSPGGLVDD